MITNFEQLINMKVGEIDDISLNFNGIHYNSKIKCCKYINLNENPCINCVFNNRKTICNGLLRVCNHNIRPDKTEVYFKVVTQGIEIREVDFKRYIPSKGKALKFVIDSYNYMTKEVEKATVYSDHSVVIDVNILHNIEEVPMEEYEEYIKNNSVRLATY